MPSFKDEKPSEQERRDRYIQAALTGLLAAGNNMEVSIEDAIIIADEMLEKLSEQG